ncbi:MAG: type II toxin-antitoxin system HicB family antitoxin [Calditrichaeota bacterium]|nr:type II toxin-antitoxin system HicB family antitoxin [Calditrichota bacterium]
MLTAYIKAAMKRAKYEIIDDPNPFYGEIPDLPGVWANGSTLEACRDELEEVLEGWIQLGIEEGDKIPVLDGIDLNIDLQPELVGAD